MNHKAPDRRTADMLNPEIYEIRSERRDGLYLTQARVDKDNARPGAWPENIGETLFFSTAGNTEREALASAFNRLLSYVNNCIGIKIVDRFSEEDAVIALRESHTS
jgi:hypothetical protein